MARNPGAMRGLSIAHIVVGFLLFCFGIADRVLVLLWTGDVYFGVWSGVWMCITGVMGIIASGRESTRTSSAFTGVFLGFCVVSALVGLGIIGSYGFTLAALWPLFWFIPVHMAIAAILLLLGMAEFIIGIWGAVSGCQNCCGDDTAPAQVVVAQNQVGYVMTQGPDGVPLAVQASGGMVAPQGVQPPIMMTTPTSGQFAGQPQFAQGSPSDATGSSSKQAEIPPSYGEYQ